MPTDKPDLVYKSLENDETLSSNSYARNAMAYESQEEESSEYTIPSRYNRDYVRLLPVNLSTYYLYWEVTEQTLRKHQIDLNKEKLTFRIQRGAKVLYEVHSSFDMGEYFIHNAFEQSDEDSDIEAHMGLETPNSDFVPLLHSNTVHTFSATTTYPSAEDAVWVKKERVWTQMVQSSTLHHTMQEGGISLAQYIQEIERLRLLSTVQEEQVSSSSPLQHNSTKKGA